MASWGRQRWSIASIWGLGTVALAIAAATVVLHVGHLHSLATPHLPWWAIAAGFAAGELAVVHLHFRGSAQSVTLSDIPWVLGLLFADAPQLLIGAILGSAAAWILNRRLPPLKIFFNIAQLALAICISETIIHAYTASTHVLGPGLWLITLSAVEAGALVAVAMIGAAITLSEGALPEGMLSDMFGVDLVITVANTTLALAGAVVIHADSQAAPLLLVPAAVLYLAYRSYLTERQRHHKLAFLYDAVRTLTQAPDVTGALDGLLERARDTFRVESAQLILFSSHGQAPVRFISRRSGDGPPPVALEPDAAEELRTLLRDSSPAEIAVPDTRRGALSAYLHASGVERALAADLPGDGRIAGVLLLNDRIGVARRFDADDVTLLRSLAADTGVAIQFDRLEQAIWQLRQLQDRVERQASTDPLTGLPNRDALTLALTHALNADGGSIAVMFIDIDDFKRVNETIGPSNADELLAGIATRLRQCVLPSDMIARMGGDEFAVLLRDPEEPSRAGVAAAERVRRTLAAPFIVGGQRVLAQASIGIAPGRSGYDEADELLRNADVAMYQAKRAGKGTAVLFQPSMRTAAIERHALHTDIETALDRGQLRVDYQPIVMLTDRRVVGAEALIRWQRHYGKLLTAQEFIPLAQETGMIVPFGEFVLQDACRQARSWLARGALDASGSVHVNLAATELDDPLLIPRVSTILERSGLQPGTLVLEISEATILRDIERVRARLDELRAVGARLAVDQFGSGQAPLDYLHELPLSCVKVAASFVQGLTRGPQEIAFLRATIALCRTLGLDVIATGVETREQAELLVSLGCQRGQGFLVGRPTSGDSVLATAYPAADDPGRWLGGHDDISSLLD